MKKKGSVSEVHDMRLSRYHGGTPVVPIKPREPISIPLRRIVRVERREDADIITSIKKIPADPRLHGRFISPPPSVVEGAEVPGRDGLPFDFVTDREQEDRLQELAERSHHKAWARRGKRRPRRSVRTGCVDAEKGIK